jgi:hypothetical protein
MTQYPVRSSADLQRACVVAQAGDVILVYGGLYDQPTTMPKRSGSPGRPIVIKAADDQWITGGKSPDANWGGKPPSEDAPGKPDVTDFAFLIIDECSHVVIDGLKIRDCWPSILLVKDTKYLQIRNCVWRNATYAIFAKKATSHLLIEDNEWQQDDSPGHDLWLTLDWERAHGNEKSDGLFRYFNGGFLSSKAIIGKVVVRHNRIMDAYNGIRLKADDSHAPTPAEMPLANADIHIFDNDFIRIRDNPTEPEFCAYNWVVRHNRLLDCHAWFSFDGVTGGFWYFYGNTGSYSSRQGPFNTFGHTMGRVLKLSYEKRPRDTASEGVPIHPWFVFNNSWHLRCPIVGGANATLPTAGDGEGPDFTAQLSFFNNAFDWCNVALDGPWLCEMIDLVHYFDMARSPGTSFDYDICDRADFMGYFAFAGQGESHGLVATRAIFEDAAAGCFALADGSEALGSGWVRTVDLPQAATAAIRRQADGSLNRGAVQDYGLVEVTDLEAQAAALVAEIISGGPVV